jgi:hypothetical protein
MFNEGDRERERERERERWIDLCCRTGATCICGCQRGTCAPGTRWQTFLSLSLSLALSRRQQQQQQAKQAATRARTAGPDRIAINLCGSRAAPSGARPTGTASASTTAALVCVVVAIVARMCVFFD